MTEITFKAKSICGREWEVPLSAVQKDYLETMADLDGTTFEVAEATYKCLPEDMETWFNEQWSWSLIDEFGIQTKEASSEDILYALNSVRRSSFDR